jgi:hypothetical protein
MENITLEKLYSVLQVPTEAVIKFTEIKKEIDVKYLTNLYYEDEDGFFDYLHTNLKGKYLEYLYIYINLAVKLYSMYQSSGIDIKIYFDTIDDIRIWANNCIKEEKVYGMKEIYWLNEHLRMRLFKLGRLQFQKREASEFMPLIKEHNLDKYFTNEYFYFVHIPEGERLSQELVIDSYQRACEFYKDEMVFAVESWILSDRLNMLFSEDSNLMKFRNDYQVLSYTKEENHITRYLKEGSSVLEKVKALEDEGIMIGEGFGICLKYVK